MSRRLAAVVLVLISCTLSSCRKEAPMRSAASEPQPLASAADSAAVPEQAKLAAAAGSEGAAPAPRPSSRKLVRTVDLSLEVKATTPVAEAIQKIAVDLGGYVGSVNAERRDGLLYYRLTVRVPVDKLDEAMAAVKKLAIRVNREQVSTEDVTDQYVDLDARVRTLEATEHELQALLAESRQKSRKVDEIMAVYRELTGIRTQIEQIKAQLANLDKLAAFSTLNVELVPTEAARPVAAPGWQPSERVRGSFRTLVNLLRGLVDFLIFFVIVLVPLGIVLFLIGKVLRQIWRRLRRKGSPVP